jgi:aryl-alcohol dehydrogenase-like predicted oxidoreductase
VLSVQNGFNILHGELPADQGVLEYAARTGISYMAWSPLARGLLTERYLDLEKVGPQDRVYDEGLLDEYTSGDTMPKLHQLAQLAHSWDLEVNQLALAYMLTLPGMGPVIPAASTVQQLESNAVAGKVTLDDEQRRLVKEALAG